MRKIADPIALVLLALSLSLNVYLYRTRPLGSRPSDYQPLAIGAVVPPLEGKSLRGSPIRISFEKPTVIYVFSPTCMWCERNLANVKYLRASIRKSYDFVAVALVTPTLEQWISDKNIDWPIVTDISPDVALRYKLGPTPQTIVLDKGGRVLHAWSGAFRSDVGDQIQKVFAITLPGLDK